MVLFNYYANSALVGFACVNGADPHLGIVYYGCLLPSNTAKITQTEIVYSDGTYILKEGYLVPTESRCQRDFLNA